MIAAGEVVERPCSVIKELVENAIDADARNIVVEIRGGGSTYIRVTDDGVGMAPEDAGVAFLRHATSKLADERGLECIGTLGFRGEALAAIASVSHIELSTRPKGGEGTYMSLNAGEIDQMQLTGCPEGTTLIVRDLFFNTPARMKFLKSDRSEASACIQAALRCALGHPEVSLRFIRDGEEEFFSPGDGREDSCVYALLGRELAAALLPCRAQEDGMSLTGFVSSPAAGRGNRAQQFFFCNGRFFKSALLQAAVEQAYKNTLLTGRYPCCVLYLNIGLGSVDVNVHPAKTEIKFSYERSVFDLVYRATLLALESERTTVARTEVEPRADFYKSMSAEEFRAQGFTVSKTPSKPDREEPLVAKSVQVPYQTRIKPLSRPGSTPIVSIIADSSMASAPKDPVFVEKPVQNVENFHSSEHKIVGEALKTYIIVEQGEELILIDKHAAHERIVFDRLRSQGREIMSQTLLCPVTLRLSGEDGELIDANHKLLGELGFEIEPFGQREYILRSVPADLVDGDAGAALEEICEKLRRGKAIDAASARDELLHTVACKAAIKAGWDTDKRELETLVEAVLSGKVRYCPHGRPVSITLTRKELDKQFKRIV